MTRATKRQLLAMRAIAVRTGFTFDPECSFEAARKFIARYRRAKPAFTSTGEVRRNWDLGSTSKMPPDHERHPLPQDVSAKQEQRRMECERRQRIRKLHQE